MTRKEEDILLSAVPFPLFLSFLCCKTGFLKLYPTPSLPTSLPLLSGPALSFSFTRRDVPRLSIPDRH